MPDSAQHARHAARQGQTVPGHAARRVVALEAPFQMYRGGVLPQVEIAYECWGELNRRRDNAVILFPGLSPDAHACSSEADPRPGWWEYMVGPGRPIDTDRDFVVCLNSLGSCFGSTGPASVDPRTGRRYNLAFPELSIEDIARAGHQALGALGLERPCTVVGASLGGMTALAYAVLYPEQVRDLVVISAATRAQPFAIALRSLQREMIRSDPAWNEGEYPPDRRPVEGMRLARKLGLLSYRSAAEWAERFSRERISPQLRPHEPFAMEFQVESYLEHQARKFIDRFDPNSYLYLSRAMDWFDLAEHGGSVEQAVAMIRARRTLVVGVETDFLFPVAQQREIVRLLHQHDHDARLAILDSTQGHDSFLVDRDRFAPAIGEFLGQP